MNIAEAQRDMRHAYYGGATGLFASATAWLVAGVFATVSSPGAAIAALLVGGMLIFPVSVILSKALGRRGSLTPGNPLGALALEGTVLLLLGIPLAYAVSLYRVEWFFPAMLLLIGGRYLTFATIYGLRLYWACGAALALGGLLAVFTGAPFLTGAFAGALVEYVFAALVFAAVRNATPASADHVA